MKTTLIVYLLFIKSLMGLNGENLENTTSITKNTSNQIKCYNCTGFLNFSNGYSQYIANLAFKDAYLNACTNEKNIIQGRPKNEFSCRTTIYPLKRMPGTTLAIIKYSIAKKEDRIKETEKENQIQDTICIDSSCIKMPICCNEDLCNSHHNFSSTNNIVYYYGDSHQNATNYFSTENTFSIVSSIKDHLNKLK